MNCRYLIGCNVIGLLLALLVKKTSKLNAVLRTIFFMPFVLSMILASFMFTYIYSQSKHQRKELLHSDFSSF